MAQGTLLERVNKFNPRCTEAQLLGFCLKSSRNIVVDFDEISPGPHNQESQRWWLMESCVAKRPFLSRRFGVNTC